MNEEYRCLLRIAESLTPDDIKKLINALQLPYGMFENIEDGIKFIHTLKTWGKHDRFLFYECLQEIGRVDLVELATKVEWLAINRPNPTDQSVESNKTSMKKLVRILKTELRTLDWYRMSMKIPDLGIGLSFTNKMEALIKSGYISNDLSLLIEWMEQIRRNNIVYSLKLLQNTLRDIPKESFLQEFRKEVAIIGQEMNFMRRLHQEFIEISHQSVKQQLEDVKLVNIESIYVQITIVEGKPRLVNEEDETTYNEIAYLRKIAKKEIAVIPLDFINRIKEYDPSKPEVWCLMGNPGCGKSFICHWISLLFGKGEFSQFSFLISIPCRHDDWHAMERSRIEAEKSIDNEFIEKWLQLSMPLCSSWTKDLVNYLVESNGDGLLIIIDGLDEYVEDVPFSDTLLFQLLTRKVLTLSTIILTTRIRAIENLSRHTLYIYRFYHVLGFTPQKRDKYFQLQLGDELKRFKELTHLHDEINQLSLIPVNASFFASLVRYSKNLITMTLTEIYSQLVYYLIKRQLYRMNLKHMITNETLFNLHPDIQDYLYAVGELAYKNIYNCEMTRDIRLMGHKILFPSQCLGLACEYMKKDSLGWKTCVWSFVHQTMNAFVGAFWLSLNSRANHCLSARYIVTSNDIFLMFRMTLRFLSGLVSDNAYNLLCILCKYLLPSLCIDKIPMRHKLRYPHLPNYEHRSLIEFTQRFVEINEILCESKSDSIDQSYSDIIRFCSLQLYFYLDQTCTPNEWKCFLRSLKFLKSISLIQIDTKIFSISKFTSLLRHLSSASLDLLAVKFSHDNYNTIRTYSGVIQDHGIQAGTKISFELYFCDLSNCELGGTYSKDFGHIENICLYYTEVPTQFLEELSHHLNQTVNLYYHPSFSTLTYNTILLHLNEATQLNGLFLYSIPSECIKILQSHLPLLTHLQEVALYGDIDVPCSSLLPFMSTLSNLKYLSLRPDADSSCKEDFLRMIYSNSHSLEVLELSDVDNLGLKSWGEFLVTLSSCTNIVELQLRDIRLEDDDVNLWSVVCGQRGLAYLYLSNIPLTTTAFMSLCIGFVCHPSIRYIELEWCNLNSTACVTLRYLLPTLRNIKKLDISCNKLSKPDPNPLKILEQISKEYYQTECKFYV